MEEIQKMEAKRSKKEESPLRSILAGLNIDVDEVERSVSQIGYVDTARIYGYNTKDYDYMVAGGRLLLYDHYNKCPSTISEYVSILEHRLDPSISEYMLRYEDRLQEALDETHERDYDTDFFASCTLWKTYLVRVHFELEPVETPSQMYLRIAVQLYKDVSIDEVLRMYHELSMKWYTHASPTIFHAGLKRPQMSSCFLSTISDDLKSILHDGVADNGIIGSNAGGLGTDVSRIRHSEIGDGGMSSGLVPMLYLYNAKTRYIDQRGRRRGAECIYLRPHHLDVVSFIEIVLKNGDQYSRTHNLNIALWVSDLFMKRVEENANWTLFDPSRTPLIRDCYGEEFERNYVWYEQEAEKLDGEFREIDLKYKEINTLLEKVNSKDVSYPELRRRRSEILKEWRAVSKKRIRYEVMPARKLYDLIVDTQRKTGLPSLLYEDACNFKSNQKNLGYIRCSNLCTEIVEYTSEDEFASCNLASISLSAHVKDREVNFEQLGVTSRSLVRNLNRVIDTNWYPLDEYDDQDRLVARGKISKTNFKHRPIGIGVSGFAEMLYQIGLSFGDLRTYEINKEVFACIYFNALVASVEEAVRHGHYETFKGSPLSQGKFQFDLWREEYELKGGNEFRKAGDDLPIDPRIWGQEPIKLENNCIIEPSWDSLRHAIMKYGVRNSLLIALMPTATTAQILRNTETCEPPESNLYSRKVMNGQYPVLNRFLVGELKGIGCWNEHTFEFLKKEYGSIAKFEKFVRSNPGLYPPSINWEHLRQITNRYRTVWEISQKVLIQMSADRSRYIDQSSSHNIFIAEPTDKQLHACHLMTWKIGLKTGIYYLRMRSAVDPIQFTVSAPPDQVCSRDNPSCLSCQ